jgi:hypothetical protein
MFDKAFSPSVGGMLYKVPMWIFHIWAVMKIVATCTGQYQFSSQNPWRQVFASKGEMNPYVIGEEARRRMAKNNSLSKDNNYMQETAAAKKDIPVDSVDAEDVWKGASGEVTDIDLGEGSESEAEDFSGEEEF